MTPPLSSQESRGRAGGWPDAPLALSTAAERNPVVGVTAAGPPGGRTDRSRPDATPRSAWHRSYDAAPVPSCVRALLVLLLAIALPASASAGPEAGLASRDVKVR